MWLWRLIILQRLDIEIKARREQQFHLVQIVHRPFNELGLVVWIENRSQHFERRNHAIQLDFINLDQLAFWFAQQRRPRCDERVLHLLEPCHVIDTLVILLVLGTKRLVELFIPRAIHHDLVEVIVQWAEPDPDAVNVPCHHLRVFGALAKPFRKGFVLQNLGWHIGGGRDVLQHILAGHRRGTVHVRHVNGDYILILIDGEDVAGLAFLDQVALEPGHRLHDAIDNRTDCLQLRNKEPSLQRHQIVGDHGLDECLQRKQRALVDRAADVAERRCRVFQIDRVFVHQHGRARPVIGYAVDHDLRAFEKIHRVWILVEHQRASRVQGIEHVE